MSPFLLFAISLALGIADRLLIVPLNLLIKKTAVAAVTVVLDLCYAVIALAPLFAVAFAFNDGIVAIYMWGAIIAGFIAAHSIL